MSLLAPLPPVSPSARVTLDLAPGPLEEGRAGPPLARRQASRLRRGRLAPQARIEPYGMSRERAQWVLVDFVLAAQARDLRLVLVITGKGRPDRGDALIPERHGILRHAVPHWLSAPPLSSRVLSVAAAHQRHGGAGALYVTLRRSAR
ncbi:hypothetical protein BH23PSE1_BH23PSE1_16650 [soil metagenome]